MRSHPLARRMILAPALALVLENSGKAPPVCSSAG